MTLASQVDADDSAATVLQSELEESWSCRRSSVRQSAGLLRGYLGQRQPSHHQQRSLQGQRKGVLVPRESGRDRDRCR
jgi:hypothetical protein